MWAVKLQSIYQQICILTIYRAPDGNYNNFLTQLEKILQKIYDPKINLILCGDINVNYLKNSSRRSQLDALLMSYNLISTVNFPTRTQNNSSSIIDNIFIDSTRFEHYSIFPLTNGLSDHDAQMLIISIPQSQPPEHLTRYIRKVNKHTITDFQFNLSYETWDSIFEGDDVNEIFNSFLNTYLRIFYSSFPLIKAKRRAANNSWITQGIKISCKHKRTLYVTSRNSDNPAIKKFYKDYCKILTEVIKEAKKLYYDAQIISSNNKMKKTWDIINLETHRKTNNGEIQSLKIEDKYVTNQQSIAESFNTYFLSVVDNIKNNNTQNHSKNMQNTINSDSLNQFMSHTHNVAYPHMKHNPTTTKEIDEIIKSLKVKDSHGYDEISTKILKISSPFIISPLNYICNKALFKGIFPDRLKFSVIKPLYKKGNKQDTSNYRPISLLTSFSKIFEKVMLNRLLTHLTKFSILSNEQYGFRTKLTTENATYKLTNEILNAMNNKLIVGGIFCDLEKAFDSVNHNILLAKLEFYGITGTDNALYKSYLENRYQRVSIYNKNLNNSTFSSWGKVKHGVPQGSIIGPVLFLIYVNDLPKAINNKSIPLLFADDTSILFTHSNLTDFTKNINTVFDTLNKWFDNNLLCVNFEKTHYIHFVTKNSTPTDMHIGIDNNIIPNVTCTKFLGLTVDNSLTWKTHIELLINKLSTACYIIRAVKPYMSHSTLITIYYSLFHSVMAYGIIFWGNSTNNPKIFKIQKRAIRIIMGRKSRDSCRNLFKELKILPFVSQYIFSLLLFVINNKNYFITNLENHSIHTRSSNNLHLPQANLAIYQKGVYYTGVKVFNNLPQDIKNISDNPKRFKRVLKHFLTTQSYYTMEEYYTR